MRAPVAVFSLTLLFAALSSVVAAPSCAIRPATSAPVLIAPPAPSVAARPIAAEEDVAIASAWYLGWRGATDPPSSLSWSKYNVVNFAFGITTPDPSVIGLDDISRRTLPDFVAAAHQNDVKALLSLGGWTGSQYFSPAVATADSRAKFLAAITGLVTQYGLDGIDFDWEYPNTQGIGCNVISPNDSANFLTFLRELRDDPVGADIIVSAAVGLTPFVGPDGTPLEDVSAYADVLDYIAIMNYDIFGSWSSAAGPNAPLDDSCSPIKAGSATYAVNSWFSAGFPVNKIVLGVASYGHSFHVPRSTAFDASGNLLANPPFDAAQQPHGDSLDSTGGVDQCGAPVGPSGVFNFWAMIEGGYLNPNGTAASGIEYRFDTCSQTPYVYNPTNQVLIAYDDADSFAAKGRFVNERGLLGFSMWNALGDSNDILVNSISSAMGVDAYCL